MTEDDDQKLNSRGIGHTIGHDFLTSKARSTNRCQILESVVRPFYRRHPDNGYPFLRAASLKQVM